MRARASKRKAGAAKAAPAAVPASTVPSAVSEAAPRKRHPADLRDMNRAELEAHALKHGLNPRNFHLSDDRLRQNIMAHLEEVFA